MKRLIILFSFISLSLLSCGQNPADAIIGEYLVQDSENGDSKVRFTKNDDGTFNCQVFWLEKSIDASTGKPRLDNKNPVESLRSQRADQIILIKGLQYNAQENQWDNAKIYDPNEGTMLYKVTCKFTSAKVLQVKRTLTCFSKTQNWEKL